MATVAAVIERAAAAEVNVQAQRMVEVRLAADWKIGQEEAKRNLSLSWNQGIIGKMPGVRKKHLLKPGGNSALLTIGEAQAHFGFFTIKRDAEYLVAEESIAEQLATFERERNRAILRWGGFPKPLKLAEGDENLGPARFPDVFVTVIEGDGERWPEIRLRDLYELGDYFDAEPRTQAAQMQSREQQLRAENEALRLEMERERRELNERMAKNEGMMQATLAALQAKEKGATPVPGGSK